MPTAPTAPAPIPFPAHERDADHHGRRLQAHSAVAQRQAERVQVIVQAAHRAGFEAGERKGYVQGWRWGLVCGVILGLLLLGGCIQAGRWVASWPIFQRPWPAVQTPAPAAPAVPAPSRLTTARRA